MVTQKKLVVSALLSILLLTSGCGEPTVNVDFDGDFNTTNGSFIMNGHLSNEVRGKSPNIESVSVYFYTQNGSLLNQTTVGGMNTEFTLTAPEQPKYIIIDSPTLWEYQGAAVAYYELQGERYTEFRVANRSELPVTPDQGS